MKSTMQSVVTSVESLENTTERAESLKMNVFLVTTQN
jgi:hypothetical protein